MHLVDVPAAARPATPMRPRCRCRAGSSGSASAAAAHAVRLQLRKRPVRSVQRPAAGPDNAEQYAYSDPVNRALGTLLPTARTAAADLDGIDWGAPKLTGLPLPALAAKFTEEFLAREWFVTGNVPPSIFSNSFEFADNSVATAGIKSYAVGVRKLFDQATARAELISVVADEPTRSLLVTWRLEGAVNLPLKPRIPPYVVITTLTIDAEGLICKQLDEFTVPGWRLLAGALQLTEECQERARDAALLLRWGLLCSARAGGRAGPSLALAANPGSRLDQVPARPPRTGVLSADGLTPPGCGPPSAGTL